MNENFQTRKKNSRTEWNAISSRKSSIITAIKLTTSNKQLISCNKQLATKIYYNCQKTCQQQQK
jgi:hypothetical protein